MRRWRRSAPKSWLRRLAMAQPTDALRGRPAPGRCPGGAPGWRRGQPRWRGPCLDLPGLAGACLGQSLFKSCSQLARSGSGQACTATQYQTGGGVCNAHGLLAFFQPMAQLCRTNRTRKTLRTFCQWAPGRSRVGLTKHAKACVRRAVTLPPDARPKGWCFCSTFLASTRLRSNSPGCSSGGKHPTSVQMPRLAPPPWPPPCPPPEPRGGLPSCMEFTRSSKRWLNNLSISATTPESSAPSKWRSSY